MFCIDLLHVVLKNLYLNLFHRRLSSFITIPSIYYCNYDLCESKGNETVRELEMLIACSLMHFQWSYIQVPWCSFETESFIAWATPRNDMDNALENKRWKSCCAKILDVFSHLHLCSVTTGMLCSVIWVSHNSHHKDFGGLPKVNFSQFLFGFLPGLHGQLILVAYPRRTALFLPRTTGPKTIDQGKIPSPRN